MECNKEEAIRAKEIAETKMQNKDFVGAKKFALKAQQLFSDLDNISQILTVCEVHCRAEVKVGGEMDWYGILQVEQLADESTIKKQYRKLALLLHPDKNMFPGAEAAFKLIGEAHMTLSDRAKRSTYDMKRKAASITKIVPRQATQQPNMTSFVRKQPVVQNNSGTATFHYGNINLQQASGSQTFWTMCPGCCMKFQYFRNLLKRSIRCHRCLTTYVTSELNEPAIPRPSESSDHPKNHYQNFKQEVPGQASHVENSFRPGFQGNATGGPSSGVNVASGQGKASNKVNPATVNTGSVGKKKNMARPSGQNSRRKKRRKKVIESSDSDSSTDSEDAVSVDDVHFEEQNAETINGRYPRRSSRMKQNVTYNEAKIEEDDEYFGNPPKRLRKSGSSHNADHGQTSPGAATGVPNNADHREDAYAASLPNGGGSRERCKVLETEQPLDDKPKAETRSNAHSGLNSETKDYPDVRSFSTPDSEFYDFEQERDASKFAADQIWAVYDDIDAMPRYYARIRQIFSPFRVRFTWLEHNPLSKTENAWTREELPIACGNYRLGKSEFTTDVQMFSHQICWKAGRKLNTFDIYPRKGEVWALFKGWDAGWSLDANNHRLYEYEVVEVLSDLSDSSDFRVVHLVKLQGFVSLFVISTAANGKLQIPPAEVLRFSHRVPSYRMSGGEREGVPEGSFELDTAALPINLGEAFPSVNLGADSVKPQKLDPDNIDSDYKFRASDGKFTMRPNEEAATENEGDKSLSPRRVNGSFDNANVNVAECPVSPSMSSPSHTSCGYLDNEFHSFQELRSIEKFHSGQIWALYSDIDEQPKFYGKIKKVDVDAALISVSWLELCPQGKDEAEWKQKDLPATCGRFRVYRRTEILTSDAFSHVVNAEPSRSLRDQYDIYPRSGQVWALYKDWNIDWTSSDLKECKYHVVEILEVSGSIVKVLVLTKVADYNAVFMPDMLGGVERKMEVPMNENLRFSHQIPAFRLTSEVGGVLQGYWELDVSSLPHI